MAHFIAQQRHAASHTATLPAAEHGYPHADFAITGGNGAGITMVAMHGQAAVVAKGLVVVQSLLEGELAVGPGFGVPVGFPGGPAVP